ncbi:E3 ubiquitin-protein ligase rnf13, partial [Coemansia sp. RSA 2049]
MSNTVSQDLVNKKLAKYRYEGIVGGETKDGKKNADVFARLIVDDDDVEGGAKLDGDVQSVVKLVSADRCSVCLEDFKVGEILRVLGCHHALHLPCGDSWFTQGSNMCPICRSEA